MEYQHLLFEVRNQIAWITFNRPESMNAINRQMTREIIEACGHAEEDSSIRLAIFTGAGERAFSAGMDLKERTEGSYSFIERRHQKLAATISVSFIKEAIDKGIELPLEQGLRLEADISALVATTEDSKEGPRAFVEKRAPVWKRR